MILKFDQYLMSGEYSANPKHLEDTLNIIRPFSVDYYPENNPTLFKMNDDNLVGIKYDAASSIEGIAFIIKTKDAPVYQDQIIEKLQLSDDNKIHLEISAPFEEFTNQTLFDIYKKFHKP